MTVIKNWAKNNYIFSCVNKKLFKNCICFTGQGKYNFTGGD